MNLFSSGTSRFQPFCLVHKHWTKHWKDAKKMAIPIESVYTIFCWLSWGFMYFFYFTQENLLKMYKLAGQFEFPPAAACVKGLCPFETHNFLKNWVKLLFYSPTTRLCAVDEWAIFCFLFKTGFMFIAPENVAALHSPMVLRRRRTGSRLSLVGLRTPHPRLLSFHEESNQSRV